MSDRYTAQKGELASEIMNLKNEMVSHLLEYSYSYGCKNQINEFIHSIHTYLVTSGLDGILKSNISAAAEILGENTVSSVPVYIERRNANVY